MYEDVLIIKNENNSKDIECDRVINEIVEFIGVLAAEMQGMADRALIDYKPVAEDIITGRIEGENDIGYRLDFMLDFCYDDRVLALYKKVLRSLVEKYPALVVDYIHAYRDMWENEEEGQEDL